MGSTSRRRRRLIPVPWRLAALVLVAAIAVVSWAAFGPDPDPDETPEPAEPSGSVDNAPSDSETDGQAPSDPRFARDYLILDGEELAELPTRGPEWSTVLTAADGDLGDPNLSDQDNDNAARTLAAALVYARTGDETYREKVETELVELQQDKIHDARVLSAGRQLAGYVIAADLVGYRDPSFVDLMGDLRTFEFGGHDRWRDITSTTQNTASNWGAWALASRAALSLYVGDHGDVAEVADLFAGFTGDRQAYSDWQKTDDFDATWVCDPDEWVPINPPGCGPKSGALVEDISRSKGEYPNITDDGITYSWETLGGLTLTAELLSNAGYDDAYEWGDRALLRAAQFLEENDGYPPEFSTNQYIPWAINRAYHVDLGPVEPAGYGRQYGFTDWLP